VEVREMTLNQSLLFSSPFWTLQSETNEASFLPSFPYQVKRIKECLYRLLLRVALHSRFKGKGEREREREKRRRKSEISSSIYLFSFRSRTRSLL
jgi:hypothetical protein